MDKVGGFYHQSRGALSRTRSWRLGQRLQRVWAFFVRFVVTPAHDTIPIVHRGVLFRRDPKADPSLRSWPKADPSLRSWPKADPSLRSWPKADPSLRSWPKADPSLRSWPKADPSPPFANSATGFGMTRKGTVGMRQRERVRDDKEGDARNDEQGDFCRFRALCEKGRARHRCRAETRRYRGGSSLAGVSGVKNLLRWRRERGKRRQWPRERPIPAIAAQYEFQAGREPLEHRKNCSRVLWCRGAH